VRRAGILESGRVLYKAIDFGYRDNHVTNCIHGISAVAEGPRLVVASPGFGEMASYYILQELEPWVLQPGCTHPEVAVALGLAQYPIIYRDYESPRSGAIGGPFFRLRGGERSLTPSYGPPR
jgi:hypothetical protein